MKEERTIKNEFRSAISQALLQWWRLVTSFTISVSERQQKTLHFSVYSIYVSTGDPQKQLTVKWHRMCAYACKITEYGGQRRHPKILASMFFPSRFQIFSTQTPVSTLGIICPKYWGLVICKICPQN